MKEALKLALEALMDNEHYVAENERHAYVVLYNEVIDKCKAALAQPVQEPVGVFCEDDDIGYVRLIPHQQMKLKAWDKLYTTPQQRPWVGLTFAEICDAEVVATDGFNNFSELKFARAIEAKLKEKNSD